MRRLASYLIVDSSSLKLIGSKNIVSLQNENGFVVKGLLSSSKHLTRGSTKRSLLGNDKVETAFINQWLEYRLLNVDSCITEKDLQSIFKELNSYLSDKAYFVGNRLTLADIFLYFGLHHAYSNMTFFEKEQLLHLSRWFRQIQSTPELRQDLNKVFFQKNLIYKGCFH